MRTKHPDDTFYCQTKEFGKESPTNEVERFLAMIRFENKGELGDLPNLSLDIQYFLKNPVRVLFLIVHSIDLYSKKM